MKLDFLQFLELEVFTRFGSRLEAGIEAKIRRGRLLWELLKQERLAPLAPEQHLAWLVAYNEGLFDGLEGEALAAALATLLARAAASPLTLERWTRGLAQRRGRIAENAMSRRRELARRLAALTDISGILSAMKGLALMETRILRDSLDSQRRMVDGIEAAAADFLTWHVELAPLPDKERELCVLRNRVSAAISTRASWRGQGRSAPNRMPLRAGPWSASASLAGSAMTTARSGAARRRRCCCA